MSSEARLPGFLLKRTIASHGAVIRIYYAGHVKSLACTLTDGRCLIECTIQSR